MIPNRNVAELQQILPRLQSELQALATKIGELESEAEEHEWVEFTAYYIVLSPISLDPS